MSSATSEDRSFLIVKDCNAWYAAANEAVLDDLGWPYQVITSEYFDGHDLSGYTDVVLPSTQTSGYYQRLNANSGKLAEFVEDGGVLHAHVATSGYPCTTEGTPAFLPGGVDTAIEYTQNLTIRQSDHPVVDGIGDLDDWNYSAHGYLTNLPGSASVVVGIAGNPEAKPTYAEYAYGDGTVLATTQTMEWPFYSGIGTRQFLYNDLQYRGDGSDIEELIAQKEQLINEIQHFAGLTIDQAEAERRVDVRAEKLVNDIAQDEFDASDEQYREALERMLAAEDVTRVSTETVTGPDSPTESNLENLYSLITGAAIELLSAAAGGIVKRVVNSIVSGIARKFDDLVRGLNGRGVIPDETMRNVRGELNKATTRSYYTYKGFAEEHPEQTRKIVESAGNRGLKGAKDAAEGLLSELDEGRSILDTVEEFYFEGYYFKPDWPVINVPAPDHIEVPNLQFSYDVPDEELPWLVRGIVPDEINFSYDTPDLDLPDGIDDVANVLEEIQEIAHSGGIDPTIDERMDHLEASLGSLDEQDDGTRAAVTNGLTAGISGLSLVTEALIDLLEGLQGLISGFSEFLGWASLAAVVAAGALIVTGIGTLGMLGLAGTLATVSAVLGIAALAVDGVQIAVGQGYMGLLTTIHQGGTLAIAETEFGGVDL